MSSLAHAASRLGVPVLALALLGSCTASAKYPPPPVLPASAPTAEVDLGPLLATVDARAITADVGFLADAELEGRDTPSHGLDVAALYLATRLERSGWSPGAVEGGAPTYLNGFPLLHRFAASGSRATLAAESAALELELGRDYAFQPFDLVDGAWDGALVWCDDGERDDFRGADLDGCWAVCRGSNQRWGRRAYYARRADALGLIVLDGEADDVEVWGGRARRGEVRWWAPPHPPRAVFPALLLAPRAGRELLELAFPGGEGVEPEPGQRGSVRFAEWRVLPPDLGRIEVSNVCALLPGRDPGLRHEAIVLCAHYDHEGVRGGRVYPGADDNASGVAAVLAVAEALARHGPLERSVAIVLTAGEEKGLFGARAWCQDPDLPPGLVPVAAINLDMVGRNAPEFLTLTPTHEHAAHNPLAAFVAELAGEEGFAQLVSADAFWDRSDQVVFHEQLGVPVLTLSSDEHEDYHQPTDTADKIDADKIARVARLVVRLLLASEVLELAPAPDGPRP